jgi:site-specific recombinase XerD
MSAPMNVSFQLKKSKADEVGRVPIYVRVTINGFRTEFSIKRNVEPHKWISSAGVVKGNSEDCKSLNAFLATVRLRLNEHYRTLLENKQAITAEAIKNAYLGILERGKTILEVFEYHNGQVEALLNKDYSFGTYERYKTARNHTRDFIEWKFRVADLDVNKIDHTFITEFEYYLKTVRHCSHNTALKYITNFKKIVRICTANGWLDKDPFSSYKARLREVERDCLTEDEINTILTKEFTMIRLEQVRDIFIFCCFTGLAYSDVKKLSKDHIIVGIDGGRWIKLNRTKTDTRSSIPILPIPGSIIEKYSNNSKCINGNRLLPVLTNQKMNGYLKEIADICGITKIITFHLARHTFATTVTLTNGVPIESVSKMLGHKSVKTTQHYAKIIDRKVSDDMMILKEKLSNKQSSPIQQAI